VRTIRLMVLLALVGCKRPAVPVSRPAAHPMHPSDTAAPLMRDTTPHPVGTKQSPDSLAAPVPARELPPNMRAILEDSIPVFVPWTMDHYDGDLQSWLLHIHSKTPWLVFGDFNSDQIEDAVIEGHDASRWLRIALVSTPSSYRLMVLESGGLSDAEVYTSTVFIAPVSPGTMDTLACDTICEDAPFTLRADAFEVIFFEKASSVWYWTGRGFASALTSD
jgi:hypothetical protein